MDRYSAWGGRHSDVRDTWQCDYCGREGVNRSRTYCDNCRAPRPAARPIGKGARQGTSPVRPTE